MEQQYVKQQKAEQYDPCVSGLLSLLLSARKECSGPTPCARMPPTLLTPASLGPGPSPPASPPIRVHRRASAVPTRFRLDLRNLRMRLSPLPLPSRGVSPGPICVICGL